jgi:hypothetical protein
VGRARFSKEYISSNPTWWVFFGIALGLFVVTLIGFLVVGIPTLFASSSSTGDEYEQMPHTA